MVDIDAIFNRALQSLRSSLAQVDKIERQFPDDVWHAATEACGEFREPHLSDLKKAAVGLGYTVEITEGKVTLTK